MSVRNRGRGKKRRWSYDFMIQGRRYRGAIPEARTKEEAGQAETQIRHSIYLGTYGRRTGKEDFVKVVSEIFLPYARLNKRSYEHDECRAAALCSYFKGKALRDVTPQMIERFKLQMLKAESNRGGTYQPATVNRYLQVLSKVFSLAVDNDLVAENPCRKVKLLEVHNERERYLTYDEEERLFAHFMGRRAHLRPVVAVALNTGIRLGALLALRWQQVDFERGEHGYITITKRHSKGKRAYDVPMNERVRAELLALQGQGGDWLGVFTNPHTGRSLTEIKRAFTGAVDDAGLTDFRFHDLRRTFATRLADKGVPLGTIRDLLGQTTLRMAQRYARTMTDSKVAAVNVLCSDKGETEGCRNFVATTRQRPAGVADAQQ